MAVCARRIVAAGMRFPTECRSGKRLALNNESERGENIFKKMIYSLNNQEKSTYPTFCNQMNYNNLGLVLLIPSIMQKTCPLQ